MKLETFRDVPALIIFDFLTELMVEGYITSEQHAKICDDKFKNDHGLLAKIIKEIGMTGDALDKFIKSESEK